MDFSSPRPGLYRVWWESGGSSLASVGVTTDGGRWIAPTNWVLPATLTPAIAASIIRMDAIGVADGRAADWREHIERAHALLGTVLGGFQ